MKLTRAQILLIVGIILINYNLYFLNEELLIYISAIVFLSIVYISLKRFVTTYLFLRMYKFYCNFLLNHLTEELFYSKVKLALLESKYNLQVQKQIFDIYNVILRNQINFFTKLVKILAALEYRYYIKASAINNNSKHLNTLKKNKFTVRKPW